MTWFRRSCGTDNHAFIPRYDDFPQLKRSIAIRKGEWYWVKWLGNICQVKVIFVHEQQGAKLVRFRFSGVCFWMSETETLEEFYRRMVKS